MEAYGKILLIAMPAFLVLVLFEKWFGWHIGKDTNRSSDMISSLSSGITNVTKNVLGLGITILTYGWLEEKVALFHIKTTWLTYIIAFIAIDFAGYWVHRIQHKINFFWNGHVIHHSSEEFNLACALRQSISSVVNIFAFLLLPAALMGVPAKIIAIVAPLQLFAQFWYHTRYISKLGVLEKIIVTPSHHRVHHAINPEYIDKNLSQIFIFWDKIFGTYQEELAGAPPVYGITRPAKTWNPIKINFQHVWLLIRDAWHTKSWKDKLRIWFMPTGWRPADVAEKYPVEHIEDVFHFEKFNPKTSKGLITWSWIQIGFLLLLVGYLFGNIAEIGNPDMFIYGVFVFLSVYAYSELMDRNRYALLWEGFKNIFGILIIYKEKDWFGLDQLVPHASLFLIAYFIFATFIAGWFVNRHEKEDRKLSIA
ncbi:MAG: sterol desaturase [Sphingobacteriales bacterium UTBCD1]|jgi:sterol desaturase/sphingolipid hydroxylase (fatty acid hydroxylase superfamily)|nr:MAG: sterol desaturase [Sphingobacteriales bacterium UTBCD1]